ncbi:MAG TPA: hypothetical protein VGO55_02240 [Allosphingosinicella sp.]|jgi:hypothetical protein|nr:hypothetical protein [Allosphingosinicella sp.]
MSRDALGAILLLVAVAGCDPGRPFDEPLARMNEVPPVPATPPQAPPAPGAVVPENCPGRAPLATMLGPVTDGPLRLEAVKCSAAGHSAGAEANLVSPDGAAIAMLDNGPDMAVTIQPVAGGEGVRIPAPSSSLQLVSTRGPAHLAWSRDSAFLWGATQPRVRPNGWALGALRPVRFFPDGRAEPLPALVHRAGPLDGLLWVGSDGLALAAFGTRGQYYRPDHEDRAPALAFVDARNGRILDTLPIARLRPASAGAFAGPSHWIRRAVAVVLPDGRLRAVLATSDWQLWTQGEQPRRVRNPYPDDRSYDMALAPGGNHVLVARALRTEGTICYEHDPRGCVPGRPVEGVLVAFHDARTGAARWTIRARVIRDHGYPTPAISPDGRFALIGLPDGEDLRVALVSMRDGAIVQQLPVLGRGSPTPMFGFQSARRFWLRIDNVTAFYRFGGAR